ISLNPVDPELLKVDVAPLVPKLRKNRMAHTDYIRHTLEEAATLREIVERVNFVSSASGSLYQDNTKNNRIRRTQKKAKKNKVEDHFLEQVRLKVPVRRIRIDNGTEFVNHTLRDYYEEVGISYVTPVRRSPQQNRVVERRNRILIEAARAMLIYTQAPLFLLAEARATACFTQNRSIIRLRYGKTPYELLQCKLPDLSFFYVFGALCYPTNDSENLGPAINEMTPGTISSGLVPTTSPSTSYVPPSRNDWDSLFQPMFDELLNPSPSVVNQAHEAITPIVEVIPSINADSTGSPSSTTVEQDAPSTSNSPTPIDTQSLVIP
nr:integrase, catalytic region, zinc finger, CCHC-type, peptidase aspartic, catalytic [Tanacetum cinerariifolium]